MTKGKLITVEGPDGSGKTTQIKELVDYLIFKGFKVMHVREPGGTAIGECVRDLLLNMDMHAQTEVLLFTASRIQNIHENILPALEKGTVVVCDRFIHSTQAYQGFGRGLKVEVEKLQTLVDDLVTIDYTLFLNISLEESIARIERRKNQAADRLDRLDLDIKARIFQGFKEAQESNPVKHFGIDASGPIESVTESVKHWVDTVFIPNSKGLLNHDRHS
jgi:dTMP kinase